MEMLTAGVIVTVADALLDGSATLVAVTVYGPPLEGAVKVRVFPLPDNDPPEEVHVTSDVDPLVTVAVKLCVPPPCRVAVVGDMDIATVAAGGSVGPSPPLQAEKSKPAVRHERTEPLRYSFMNNLVKVDMVQKLRAVRSLASSNRAYNSVMIPTNKAVIGALLLFATTLQAQPPGGRSGGAGVEIKAGEACPPGMTEVRPLRCQAPQLPVPGMLDYRPKSTLVAPEKLVPKAKYPVVDFHGHPSALLGTAAGLESLGASMDSLNVRLMIAADNMSGERLRSVMTLVKASPSMKDRVRVLAGINFNDVGPGWAAKAIAQLEADVAAGAVGIGEISKSLGLSIRKRDGSRLQIDDPELDPIWQAAARLKLPVFIHTADPSEFFKEPNLNNERWLELALFPGRRYPQDRFPSFEQLATERDNLFRRNRATTFVTAHLGWHANDLARLGKLFDELPNVYSEVGAVLYDIGRQPRGAHDFFVKYQDRILFGKDSFQPREYPYYWRVFETRDDYFDYYRDYHAFWKLYGIDLPDAVLKKVYYQNALRIMPAVSTEGWPK